MAHNIRTDLVAHGSAKVRRITEALTAEALVATKSLAASSTGYLYVSAAATQDVVLPDASTLERGAIFTIDVTDASVASVNVKTYDDVTPALLKNILPGRAYEFRLVENATEAGVWRTNWLESDGMIVAERYVHAFNATDDWTLSAGNYELTLTEAVHGRGVNPTIEVTEGSDPFQEVDTDVLVAANGDITIRVVSDSRFAGQLIVV